MSKRLASRLARAGWTPNQISVAGVCAALVAGMAFGVTSLMPEWARVWFLLGAVLVQARLLANMLDGMVAVEFGKASPVGELYNEVPDRLSDILILVGLGYAAGGSVALGWAAAVAAVLTAYVRAQAAVAGAPQEFCGPMAKPQRMFLITVAAIYCVVTPASWQPVTEGGYGIAAGCVLVVFLGSVATAARRLVRSARALSR